MVGRKSVAVMVLMIIAMNMTGCALLRKAVRRPEVSFQTLTLESVDFEQASIALLFDITNPNLFSVPVKAYQYDVRIGDHTVISTTSPAKLNLPAGGSGTLSVPATLVFADVTSAVETLAESDTWPYTVKGSIEIDAGPLSGITIPFSHSGEVPRPVMPNIGIRSVNIRSVSLLNYEMDVVVRIENTGSVAYVLDALNGTMELNGRKLVTIDSITDVVELEPGAREITLPVRLSAENLIQALIGFIREGQVRYQLNGEAVIRNDTFGTLPMRLDTQGRVPVTSE
jgi:LEA14-like dessication related protein